MKKEIKMKEKETGIEMVARLVVDGFEKIEQKFSSVNSRLDGIDSRLDGIDSRLTNLTIEQGETNRRLSSLEKKQMGTLLSLDETVHRNEFDKVVRRVEVLEKR
ncbi:MAG: hypothetical protein NTZ13_00260 [Candidatus Parcubacteria bacterium]|nr:hypothetical protein [Candidatus Parcubacteria bacterium]